LRRGGRGTSIGLTKIDAESATSVLLRNQVLKKQKLTPAIVEQIQKQAIQAPIISQLAREQSNVVRAVTLTGTTAQYGKTKMSEYYGKGLYERTDETAGTLPRSMAKEMTIPKTILARPLELPVHRRLTLPSLSMAAKQESRLRMIERQETLLRTQQLNRQLNLLRTSNLLKQANLQRPLQKQQQRQRTLQQQKQLQRQIMKSKTHIPVLPIFSPLFKRGKQGRSMASLVDVQIRRDKKFKTIGKGLSLAKAINLGSALTKTTLARTFRLRGNIPLNVKLPIDTNMFRTPRGKARFKEAPFTFIEKGKYALNVRKEKTDIALAKLLRGKLRL